MQATYNQTFFDLAAMGTGTIESAFDIAAAAGMSLTDDPVPGTEYTVPEGVPVVKEIVKYLAERKIEIGTQETPTEGVGLGVMVLGSIYKID